MTKKRSIRVCLDKIGPQLLAMLVIERAKIPK
jgi:hypothetical protein